MQEKPAGRLEKGPSRDKAEELLEIVRQLALELNPGRKHSLIVTLDSSLDRDMGFDSLARVELLARIERAFDLMLSEQLLAGAETPRDILRALFRSGVPARLGTEVEEAAPAAPDESGVRPADAQTLVEVLNRHVSSHPDRLHVLLYGEGDSREEVTYRKLRDEAAAVAAGLQVRGLEPGQTVVLMLPTGLEYLACFYGILMSGGVPVSLYPPVRKTQVEEHLRRHRGILDNSLARMLITVSEVKPLARLLKAQVGSLRHVLSVGEVRAQGSGFTQPPLSANDVAFLQYTSGSTGSPKGVILTHANLLANIRAMGDAVDARSTDVFVSWLPLYHDMGLIGAWLGSLYHACQLVLMSPLAFLSRPERWLWAIHRHRGTLSASPNFGYEFCLRRIDDRDIEGLDLSSWRVAFNGAEPVSAETVLRFPERFARYGFRREAVTPVYGLAESSVGLCFPPMGRGPVIDRVRREPFIRSGRAIPAPEMDPKALRFVGCGKALAGHRIRIVDAEGREVPERQEGRLYFRGPSVTGGYFRNPAETGRLFHGEWLDSGDLAYIAEGEVYPTGRVKDVVIRGGRNIYPHELEEAVGELGGVRKGCVAVFGSLDPVSGTENLVVVAETRETDGRALEQLHKSINTVATDLVGMPPDKVVLAPPHTVLKTSSGKIRRSSTRDIYERGLIGKPPAAFWRQLARLALAGFVPQLRRAWAAAGRFLFAVYVWTLFCLFAPFAWLLVVLLPVSSWRWRVLRCLARLLARFSCTPLIVRGLGNIPSDRPVVVVSNHMSYLDSYFMAAALPIKFSFVAKAELKKHFAVRLFLSRMNVEFVERFDVTHVVSDARRVAESAVRGRSLLFFPEGTFHRLPGLLPFHMGAFVAAVEAGISVVPVTIRGTRYILRSRSWFPRRGIVSITIGKPLAPKGSDWASAVDLRDRAREEILRHCGEPDLAGTRPPVRGRRQ